MEWQLAAQSSSRTLIELSDADSTLVALMMWTSSLSWENVRDEYNAKVHGRQVLTRDEYEAMAQSKARLSHRVHVLMESNLRSWADSKDCDSESMD